MMATAGKRHTDRAYEAELRQVRENLLLMAGYVQTMIVDSVRALIEGQRDVADSTILTDRRVNRLEIDTDELCLLILAKRQPLATDLRFITTAMKMVTDLERVGDLAVNICERAKALGAAVKMPAFVDHFERMSRIVESMVHDAIDAFVTGDSDRAYEVFDRDEEVDQLYLKVCADIQAVVHSDPDLVERGMHHQAVAKFLERIGDHATNLAELVVFVVVGKDIRHLHKLEITDEL